MTGKDKAFEENDGLAPPRIDLAAFLDRARDAVIVQDLDGAVRYWNRSAARIFGWTSSEALGRCVQDFLCGDPRSIDEALAGVLAAESWSGEIKYIAKCGAEVVVESHWTVLSEEGSHSRSVLTFSTDVTEKRKSEAGAVQIRRMESIAAFASGIAHDLNNVLGPIIMAVDLFKLTMKSPRELELLETVDVSAQRGAEIVKQVMSMTNGLRGKSALDEDIEEGTTDGSGKTRRGNGELILLIDDEASIRMIMSQTLQAFGYEVLTACDGADGVAKYAGRRGEIAAVITDMMMPVMGGAATISVLMQLDPSVRVLATSGLNLKGAELKATHSGVKAFLRKPFTTEKLLSALRDVLQAEA